MNNPNRATHEVALSNGKIVLTVVDYVTGRDKREVESEMFLQSELKQRFDTDAKNGKTTEGISGSFDAKLVHSLQDLRLQKAIVSITVHNADGSGTGIQDPKEIVEFVLDLPTNLTDEVRNIVLEIFGEGPNDGAAKKD